MNAKRLFAMGLSLCLLFGVVGCNTTKPVHVLGESGKASSSKNSSKVASSEKTQSVLSALSEAASKRSVSEVVSKKAASSAAAVSKAASNSLPINTVYGNTPGNINNGGYACASGDWIYYVNRNDSSKLYKTKTDGVGNFKVMDYPILGCINVVGDWIYFIGAPDRKIYKVKIDGTGYTKLNNRQSEYLNVVGEWIYHIAYLPNSIDKNTMKIKTDGTNEILLSEEPYNTCNIVGDWMYYFSGWDHYLYKMKTDGSGIKEKIYSVYPQNLIVVDNWIFYFFGGYLYKMRTDGTGNTKALQEKVSSTYNISGDWIYYTEPTQTNLYKIKMDGTGKMKLSTLSIRNICIVGDWVFYISGFDMVRRLCTDGTLV